MIDTILNYSYGAHGIDWALFWFVCFLGLWLFVNRATSKLAPRPEPRQTIDSIRRANLERLARLGKGKR